MPCNARLTIAATILLAAAAACVHADEENVTMDKLPAAVQAAVKKAMPGVADATFSKEEEEDGKVTYEAEYKVGNVAHSATFGADGKLIEQEEDAKMSDLPAAAAAAIRKAAGDAKVGGLSKVTADGKTFYEAEYTAGEDKHEVKVNADGSVISNKVEKEDDEKEEKDGKSEKHEKKD